MKKRGLFFTGLCVFILLVLLMIFFETTGPDSRVENIGEAVWYTLIPLTTVGYDSFPSTTGGRIVGAFFAIFSLGILTYLLSFCVSEFKGKILPLSRLLFLKKLEWFVFSETTDATITLAKNILKEYPGSVVIFCGVASKEEWFDQDLEGENVFCVSFLADYLVKKKKGCNVFFLSDDISENEKRASRIKHEPCEIYCKTEKDIFEDNGNVHFFDLDETIARTFWRKHPVLNSETNILIVGDGKIPETILEKAILTNVYGKGHKINYYVFTSSDHFENLHYELKNCMDIFHEEVGNTDSDKDAIIFIKSPWQKAVSVIKSAHRIVFCDDNCDKNLDNLAELNKFFVHFSKVYVHADVAGGNAVSFGTNEELFTSENVMKKTIDMLAYRMNENYRAAELKKGHVAPEWKDLSTFIKVSNISAADHLYVKTRILLGTDTEYKERFSDAFNVYKDLSEEKRMELRELEHERWLRLHYLYNFRFATVRNDDMREHPSMVPFNELSMENKLKDDYAWYLLKELAND